MTSVSGGSLEESSPDFTDGFLTCIGNNIVIVQGEMSEFLPAVTLGELLDVSPL
jgi:hypothetical protein